ncbi:hypothetical protein TanjilG_20395 [Lupinus angustifolius]|uniref:HTH myb-type domain-containing protein n=1 Tax=Lupinus angustifolius TaxID=3871 RepID=A0A4P1RWT8_LUPAN|nr:hypothetical protein TanjilG_20395 [Lupinus angustifolius]
MSYWLTTLTRSNLVVCLCHLIILLPRTQQAMRAMKELTRREAVSGIITMSPILRFQNQIKNDERVLPGPRKNTGYFFLVWRSMEKVIGEVYLGTVVTRTPTQVASHAQKYFIRLNSMNKDRRRSSIHDITSVNNGDVSAALGPITSQTNVASRNSTGKLTKQGPPTPTGASVVGLYGPPTVGQAIGGGPLVSAVGTPVNLPPPHMAYGVRAPVHGAVVPGAVMNFGHMPYHMPPPHR